jgi:hypothetical protein
MEFKEIKDKQDYLEKNYPYMGVPELNDKKYCIHCGEYFIVGDYKVEIKDKEEYIVCPNAPKCDGNVMDWIDKQWTTKK